MPFDLPPLDIAALVWFFAGWLGYGVVFDYVLQRRQRPIGLNQEMKGIRLAWMRRMLERDNRITDAALVGHTIHSISFFASTTMIVLAGLVGLIGGLDKTYEVVAGLKFTAGTTREVFALKMFLLFVIFVFAFFQFTWALRQYNYLCALIGAAPLPPVAEPVRERAAAQISTVLTLAMTSFNSGLRAYYFALAALTWFVHPWVFMAATLVMVLILLRRQFLSRTHAAIATERRIVHHAARRSRK